MSAPPVIKCTTCHRSPGAMNGPFSECSHAECSHRRLSWPVHTPASDGRTPPAINPSEQET